MGFFSTGRKIEEAKMALVGKYLFERLTEDQRHMIINVANYRLKEGGHSSSVEKLEARVQWVFWALAMADIGIEHRLKSFQWTYIRNPFMITTLQSTHWEVAAEILSKKNGISITPP
ncbi:MAG: hypothetical protein JW976_12200 [Syntrophaceae bacterium]|nr:hypothetical protein [Syntrophaceae bacterium]